MVEYKERLVAALKELGLPVYYELFVDSSTPIPCLTYMEQNDYTHIKSDTIQYSYKTYRIKLWGNNLKQLDTHSLLLDEKMRSLGFKRTNYNELAFGSNEIVLVFDYQGLAYEY